MWLERTVRQISVGKRSAVAAVVLVLPMTLLIAATMVVLQRQETDLHHTIDEAVNALVPMTTLEYDLQRALTDDLDAETNQSIPDYGGLTSSIDRLFSQLRGQSTDPTIPVASINSAQMAWRTARPAIERLVEQVTPLRIVGNSPAAKRIRAELSQALQDVDTARTHLTRAVKAHAAAMVAAQQRQLRLLVWTWAATLLAAFFILSTMVYSIVKPAQTLAQAVRQLSRGDLSVRLDSRARDELGVVAAYLNTMAARFAARNRALEGEAREDPLTNLPNRRGICVALESALVSSQQLGTPLSVLMIDVDRFKEINDRFGHGAGDVALLWVAETMRASLREEDILGRYAGDEFLAVLPDASNEQARWVAERLCNRLHGAARVDPMKPSVTVGVATAPGNGDTAEQLIEAADKALFQGKEAGRARVAVA